MSDAATLRQRLFLGPVRILLRRAWIPRALGLISVVRALVYQFLFRRRPRGEVTVRMEDLVLNFSISSPYEMQRAITLGGEKKILRRLCQEVWPGDVVYDIGANCGLYTVALAKAVGTEGCIIGFEPESRGFQLCRQNTTLNSLRNVRLFNRALGNEERETALVAEGSPGSGAAHVLRRRECTTHQQLQPTSVVIGDRFIAEHALPAPNVIKIDVEGMEEEVLLGLAHTLQRPECRLVLCEVHFGILDRLGRRDAPKSILDFLSACGFRKIDWLDSGHFIARKLASGEE